MIRSREPPFLNDRCLFILGYQIPLKQEHADKAWGKLDLVGVAPSRHPMVIELKKGDANDTPLRLVVEAVSYAIAIREAWNHKEQHFWKAWSEALRSEGVEAPSRTRLDRIHAICAAPAEYWQRCIGLRGTRGAVGEDAWQAFRKVVEALEREGFPTTFARLTCKRLSARGVPEGIMAEEIFPWVP